MVSLMFRFFAGVWILLAFAFLSGCVGVGDDSRFGLFADGVSKFSSRVRSNVGVMRFMDGERRASLEALHFVDGTGISLSDEALWLSDSDFGERLEFLSSLVIYADGLSIGGAGGDFFGDIVRSDYRRDELLPLMLENHVSLERDLGLLRDDIVGSDGSFKTLLGDIVASLDSNEERLLLVVRSDEGFDSLVLYGEVRDYLRERQRRVAVVSIWDDVGLVLDDLVAAHAELSGMSGFSGAVHRFHSSASRLYEDGLRWSDYGG